MTIYSFIKSPCDPILIANFDWLDNFFNFTSKSRIITHDYVCQVQHFNLYAKVRFTILVTDIVNQFEESHAEWLLNGRYCVMEQNLFSKISGKIHEN